jgi:hypothetical protein
MWYKSTIMAYTFEQTTKVEDLPLYVVPEGGTEAAPRSQQVARVTRAAGTRHLSGGTESIERGSRLKRLGTVMLVAAVAVLATVNAFTDTDRSDSMPTPPPAPQEISSGHEQLLTPALVAKRTQKRILDLADYIRDEYHRGAPVQVLSLDGDRSLVKVQRGNREVSANVATSEFLVGQPFAEDQVTQADIMVTIAEGPDAGLHGIGWARNRAGDFTGNITEPGGSTGFHIVDVDGGSTASSRAASPESIANYAWGRAGDFLVAK